MLISLLGYSRKEGTCFQTAGPRFLRVPNSFRRRKAVTKSPTLCIQGCFIHIVLILRAVPFIQDVSGVYTLVCL